MESHDRLVRLGEVSLARRVAGLLGASLPPSLRRAPGPWTAHPLEGRTILAVPGPGAVHTRAIAETLARAGAEPWVLGSTALFSQAGEAWARPARALASDTALRADAIVFDASGVSDLDALRSLYAALHPHIRELRRSGRVVVVGAVPEEAEGLLGQVAQRALEGFVRSLAKEVGRKGATANLLQVADGGGASLEPALRWLLSDRSAYVSGQPLRVAAGTVAEPRFVQPLGGRVALVTGAARGIGAATARALAREGARVVVLDRPDDAEAAQAVAAAIGGEVFLADVTAADTPARLAARFADGLDVVVHNAGVTRDRTLGRMAAEQWDLVLDVNLRAILGMNAVLLPLLRDGGRVVCLSSVGGISGNPGQTNYAASKAGVIGLVEALAAPLAQRGVVINAVAPGFIETRMTAAMPVATREVARRLSNLGQGGLPEDIAEAVVFLSSPGAGGVSGRVLRVCGGNLVGA